MKNGSPLGIMLLLISFDTALCADEKLYLHCFSPTSRQAIQWEGSPKVEEPTAPARLITLNVSIGSDFEAILPSHRYVSGKVTRVNEMMGIALEGSFGSSFAFSGNVQLEAVFKTQQTSISGVNFTILCVLSKHKEIEPFLKAQADADRERLRRATEQSKRNAEEAMKRDAEQAAPSDGDKPSK